MNKKRRRLTLAALAAFGLIIFFHYCDPSRGRFGTGGAWHGGRYHAGSIEPLIADVRMPLFALAVVYAGLFFLFGGQDAEPVPRRPRNWRRVRISGVILGGLLVIVGLIGAIIDSHEQERQRESIRRSAIATEQTNRERERKRVAQLQEWEESKHRITRSEIDLIDLRLEPVGNSNGEYVLSGRIRNRAAHNHTLNSITLMVTLREKAGSDILGQGTWSIRIEVPPHQTRGIFTLIEFPDLPLLRERVWNYDVTEIRGRKGMFDDLIPAVTPTPSPKP
jgi:hypothetical protein